MPFNDRRPRRRPTVPGLVVVLVFAALSLAVPAVPAGAEPGPVRLYGTLQSSPSRLATTAAAGVDLVTLDVSWKRFEPTEGRVDRTYLDEVRTTLARYRAAGMQVVLNTGVHHTPTWVFALPNSRYVNQYGDAYAPSDTGKKVANMVFNQQVRDKQQNYLGRLFGALGTDFHGVRLGGGWYGELNYPDATYSGRTNAYWGFDAVARGVAAGLPSGMMPNPVPGWVPGTPSADHDAARRFADWYLDSLGNYHDWQIETVRHWYPGRLLMLYPSWGIRPGQLDAAVSADLAGSTSAERNGEVQRGFDFARYIRGITDPGVVVYTTWLNADASADGRADPRYWSPVKYLASLATDRPQPLAVMGENTGRDSVADMRLTFEQARRYQLQAVVWAFEPELYGGVYASIGDYAAAIREDRSA
ncbi:beta-galactosidase [Geodermatophilus sp. SYSU D00758]